MNKDELNLYSNETFGEICPICGGEDVISPNYIGMGAPNRKCKSCGEHWTVCPSVRLEVNEEVNNNIENLLYRLIYFPIAIAQWLIFTFIFTGFSLFSVTPVLLLFSFYNLIILEFEYSKECFILAIFPIKYPFIWIYRYVAYGEIGLGV